MSDTNTKPSYNPWLRSLAYVVVFVVFNLTLGFACYKEYGVQANIDWVLAGIYAMLALFSFYVFVVNDIHT